MDERDLVIAITPFAEPWPRLVVAALRAGAVGVLDLGRDEAAGRAALAETLRWAPSPFGVRVPAGCPLQPSDLPPEALDTVVLAADSPWRPDAVPGARRVLVEVTSAGEADLAVHAGATGLIARGNEAGGRVGDLTTFVLLQRLMAGSGPGVPVWAAGGIGLHTAAAAVAGGAAGVVLDTQLALTDAVDLPPGVAAAVRAMDGSETRVIGGHRVLVRPDLPIASDSHGTGIADRLGARNLATQALPVGQDGALAGPLARRYRTAGSIITAVRRSVTDHLSQAAKLEPLAPGAPFARARGLRYPVAQGPMTRVSDSPAFAAAVADAGGLPFLALALMPGQRVRDLLAETAAALGHQPWGVGILGFVPPEVREAQLEAVLAARPPCALIAGGRPAQAAQLEAAGIDTFLHVPSPGLLDLFLGEGARKFVFEGLECGGHVGPRASFALWETQVERLLASGVVDELQVLFAGGIHDERSAAMVAALAAPLTGRGAGVGILMGTAYLFTEEAVAAGAVVDGFQDAAVSCERTVLLETSPGHATRCADSAYASAFAEAKRALQAEGRPTSEVWAELERLNLGRLRIAAKGLRRDGDRLLPVQPVDQRAEGMYMIGQVAALRSGVSTVAGLHAQVTSGATDHLAARVAELRTPPEDPAAALDIAIVGMAGAFGGAGDVARYWSNVLAGVDAIGEVPADRWDPDVYYDPNGTSGQQMPSRWGGFLPDVPFDALAYGIPPASLASIDPMQLLALEVSARALADAGYGDDRPFDRERTSVIFGAEPGTDLANAYSFRSLLPAYFGAVPDGLAGQLPALTEDSFPGVLGNVIAGRVANRLDLGGTNCTVDAACAASLAAVDAACKELSTGTSDMVLCGAVDTHNGIGDYQLFASVHALSPDGRCRTFDSSAQGIVLGEGAGCVVLKRLADAERDGDRIYAVIRGVGASSDGRSLGLTAPRPEGQRRALERAYRMAGVSPADVGLVEAHGTGTVVGDRTELATLTELFTDAGAAPDSCALGSVKSQIGHTKCAAGLAALIKAARAVYAGVRPPTNNLTEPNPYWDPKTSPFFFDTAARPWAAEPARRLAGVSAFGFGGANFHVVLGGYDGAPEPPHGLDEWPAELFVLDGAAMVERLGELVAANDRAGRPWRLRDLARTVAGWATGTGGAATHALVADDLDDLAAKLDRARAATTDPVRPAAPKVALLFPGQGSQRPGALADLFVAFPRLQRFLRAGGAVSGAMFPPATFTAAQRAERQAALTDTRMAQPALGVAGLAVHELLTTLGVRPGCTAGHSYGELVALCVAGAFDERTLLELSTARADAILDAAGDEPGAMAAVRAAPDRLAEALGGDTGVVLANHNAPGQVVISGPSAAVAEALDRLAAQGLPAERLNVACAFHSPVVAAAAERLAGELSRRTVHAPGIPVWSNTTAAPYAADPDAVRAGLARQVAEPVRFADQVRSMYDSGVRVFVEAGPGRVLTGLVGRILGDRPHHAVAVDVPGEHGLKSLLLALAELAVAGVPVDTAPLFAGRDARVVSADDTPRRPGWLVNGHLVRTADGQYLPGGLRPAQRVPVPGAAPPVDRDTAVLEFLRTSRELVAAQRDVLLGYLGTAPVTAAAPALPVAVAAAPAPAVPVAASVEAEPVALTDPDDVMRAVLAIVSERTGYPLDMLDPDLDLEADLSIDSIKRTEILGELARRANLPGDTSLMEQVAQLKTLRSIVEWTTNRTSHTQTQPAVRRYRVEMAPVDQASGGTASLAGRRFAVVDDGLGIGTELAARLRSAGADVVGPADGRPDGLVFLAVDPAGGPVLPGAFEVLRAALVNGAGWLLIVTGSGGALGHGGGPNGGPHPSIGLRGFARSAALEFPDSVVRAVDVEPSAAPGDIAERLLAELADPGGPVVVGLANGTRAVPRLVAADLPAPAGRVGSLGLDAHAVVLLTGGARGITAAAAKAIARASGCHIELIGRTASPTGPEDPATSGATDAVALRRALAARGGSTPVEIGAATSRLLAEREIRTTLADLAGVAASVRYHAADVCDPDAVRAVVDGIYARRGRLDGVVHGAGVLADKLLRDKTPDAFAAVYRTKVDGARALVDALRDDSAFLVFFASASGVLGNRGQTDYAAANDALDCLAHHLAGRRKGRVLAVDWGPWAPAGGGMVSAELARAYQQRGIQTIDPADGVSCLLSELASGEAAQVVYVAGNLADG